MLTELFFIPTILVLQHWAASRLNTCWWLFSNSLGVEWGSGSDQTAFTWTWFFQETADQVKQRQCSRDWVPVKSVFPFQCLQGCFSKLTIHGSSKAEMGEAHVKMTQPLRFLPSFSHFSLIILLLWSCEELVIRILLQYNKRNGMLKGIISLFHRVYVGLPLLFMTEVFFQMFPLYMLLVTTGPAAKVLRKLVSSTFRLLWAGSYANRQITEKIVNHLGKKHKRPLLL